MVSGIYKPLVVCVAVARAASMIDLRGIEGRDMVGSTYFVLEPVASQRRNVIECNTALVVNQSLKRWIMVCFFSFCFCF